jgi:1,2-diacylglycerol-3-alpha-glucose alpha-1,2-galactosyltransferase
MKIRVNMLSSADAVEGQGVGSAYLELINLLKEEAYHAIDLTINESGYFDINHIHTIDPMNFYKIKMHKGANIMAVHFLASYTGGVHRLTKVYLCRPEALYYRLL